MSPSPTNSRDVFVVVRVDARASAARRARAISSLRIASPAVARVVVVVVV
jgi:hypothetical protein